MRSWIEGVGAAISRFSGFCCAKLTAHALSTHCAHHLAHPFFLLKSYIYYYLSERVSK